MDKSTPTTADKLNYALHLTQEFPKALVHYMAPMDKVRQRLEELDERTCTGNIHWRDKNAAGKTAKLYVLHGTGQACPIHGNPEPGRRNRVYIGNKPDKIADALAAIERDAERVKLQRELARLQETLNRVTYRIKDLYYRLGQFLPEMGKDPSPTQTQNP